MSKKIERKNNIKIIKNEENPETPEVLAASLIAISDGIKQLCGERKGLTHNAVVALICNMQGNYHLNKTEVTLVLESIGRLKSYYVRA